LSAIEIVNTQSIDIIFMDISLEGSMNGIECAKIINQKYQIPIIYTTAFQDTKTIQEATETNLYGYLVKPFDFVNVRVALEVAISKIILDNRQTNDYQRICEIYEFDTKTETIFREGEPIILSKNESKLFASLFKNINHNVSNEYLAYSVWEDEEVDVSRIRNSILRLRKKLPELNIQTITGIGYMLRECY